jgi:cyclic pyranopterin phosphate synthase
MPENGIQYVEKSALLSYEEMVRLIQILAKKGIKKIRITGGEPFVRKGMMNFLTTICQLSGIKEVHLTTNGTVTAPLVLELKKIGIKSVNLSIDSLDRQRFFDITRRDVLPAVMDTFRELLKYEIPTKINAVVMNGKNTDDIIPMINLTKDHPVSVRFIEEMPFNGSGEDHGLSLWNHKKILDKIKTVYPTLEKIPDPAFSTSANYKIPGHPGTLGIIAAYSRTFCGTCNRIRLTPTGLLKTCLYDNGIFNVKDFLRAGASDAELSALFSNALSHRAKDGFEAEKNRRGGQSVSESMATIGG